MWKSKSAGNTDLSTHTCRIWRLFFSIWRTFTSTKKTSHFDGKNRKDGCQHLETCNLCIFTPNWLRGCTAKRSARRITSPAFQCAPSIITKPNVRSWRVLRSIPAHRDELEKVSVSSHDVKHHPLDPPTEGWVRRLAGAVIEIQWEQLAAAASWHFSSRIRLVCLSCGSGKVFPSNLNFSRLCN